MENCKFKIGEKVIHPPDLYGHTESVVKSFTRVFYNNDGNLGYAEEDLSSLNEDIKWGIIEGKIPILVIYPHKTTEWCMSHGRMEEIMTNEKRIIFSHYAYTVSNIDMNTFFPEKVLNSKNLKS
jgi:hypothetical protein